MERMDRSLISKNKVDIVEDDIESLDPDLLDILLADRTADRNGKIKIIWATDDYESIGIGFGKTDEIKPYLITKEYKNIIHPRSTKDPDHQIERTKERAEVFTPPWVCNKQNNLVDEQWFGRPNVFNTETVNGWKTERSTIVFPDSPGKTWQDYVKAKRMEVACGEAPYLVSRYNTITGIPIKVIDRIGLLDRKLRVISENVHERDAWIGWAFIAYKSIYGYEFQGDNLLIARENLLWSLMEHYYYKFTVPLDNNDILKEFAFIISWNVFQMDGLNYAIPYDVVRNDMDQISIFDLIEGTKTSKKKTRFAKIMNWERNKTVEFKNAFPRRYKNGS